MTPVAWVTAAASFPSGSIDVAPEVLDTIKRRRPG